MTLAGVTFSFAGQNAQQAPGWQINDAEGGYDQATGMMTEDEWRAIGAPSQGEVVQARTGATLIWSGRMAQPPQLKDGMASWAAVGHNAKAEQKGARLFIQSADMSQWVPFDADPHQDTGGPKYDHSRKWNLETTNHAIRYTLDRNQNLSTGDGVAAIFYAEGVDLARVKWTQDYNVLDEKAKLEIKVQRANGPLGAATNVTTGGAPVALNTVNNGADFDISFAAVGYDLMILMANCNDGTFTPNTDKMMWRLRNVRVNSTITSADTFNAYQVIQEIAAGCGFGDTGVVASTFNVLPFDWENGSWLDAMTYVADLEDNYVRVGDEDVEYDAWGTVNWEVTQAVDATPDLKPLELANQVRVLYETPSGVTRKVVRSTTDVAITNPLAASGITNTIEATMEDRQRSETVPTAVADKLVRRYARQRYAGTIDLASGVANTGNDDVRQIRYGDTIRINDWAPAANLTLRAVEVSQTHDGVRVGLEQPVNVASLIAHTSGHRRRHKRRNHHRTSGAGSMPY